MEDLWARLCVSRLCKNLAVLTGFLFLRDCGKAAAVTPTVSLPHHLSLYPTGVHGGGTDWSPRLSWNRVFSFSIIPVTFRCKWKGPHFYF